MTTNYLNNKALTQYIHDSKASYTWYIDGTHKNTKYKDYDVILCGTDIYEEARSKLMLQLINMKRRSDLKTNASILRDEDLSYLTEDDYSYIKNKIVEFDGEFTDLIKEKARLGKYNRELYAAGKKRVSELPENVTYADEDLVVRVYSYKHIPMKEISEEKAALEKEKDATRTRKRKTSETKTKLNFPPYVHCAILDGRVQVVAKSHYDKNEMFSTTHGTISPALASAYLLQSRRVSYNHNTKGYSYVDDMVSHASLQLVMVGLQFNELYSDNPFAYFTTVINNAFTTILKDEKRTRDFRDKMLMDMGYNPSHTEQINQDTARAEHWENVLHGDGFTAGDDSGFIQDEDAWAIEAKNRREERGRFGEHEEKDSITQDVEEDAEAFDGDGDEAEVDFDESPELESLDD